MSGADSDALYFDSEGVLSFREDHEPDYEEQSSYSITIEARSGEGPRRLTAELDVTIEVLNGEDAGDVSLSQREPQIGKMVHATVSDPDGGVRISRWIWERSEVITVSEGTPSAECRDDPGTPGIRVVAGWTPIDGASSSVYTVQGADVDTCLRATATYTDDVENAAGAADEQLTGMTEAPIQSSNPANTAPHFVVQSGRTSRRVAENTEAGHDIGTPISAHDEDGDLLIYTLGGVDSAFFGISRNNGQVKTKAALDYEARRFYLVEVTATDPSGATDSIAVPILLTDMDEPAEIAGSSSIDFAENESSPVAAFSAHDHDRRAIRWSLSGRDEDRFTIRGGVLRFRKRPDYEEPHSALEGASLADRNVYRVTVEVSGGTHDVAVTVMDVDEAGSVVIDRPQPQVDRPLSARLRDEDDRVGQKWQWSRSEDGRSWTDIEGARSPRRSPAPADVGMYLRAAVTYSDRFGSGKTASAVSTYRVEAKTLANAAPSFAEQDEDEDTTYIEVSRSVDENTAPGTAIGEQVTALDEDEDELFYELLDTCDLADEDGHVRFTIDSDSGQIRVAEELGTDAREHLDNDPDEGEDKDLRKPPCVGPSLPEGEDAGAPRNSEYVLRVMASDPSTASATVNVIVRVTEVNEPPTFDEDAPTVLRVRENQKDDAGNPVPPVLSLEDGARQLPEDAYRATDQDGGDTLISFSLSGADRSDFTIDQDGVLSFREGREPDFEEKSSYSITVKASSGGQSTTLDVVIDVVNTHDVGEIILSQRQPQVGIEIVATVSDPDGGVEITRWVWERTEDGGLAPSTECEDIEADSNWTPIGEASSSVYAPKGEDVGTCLRATAVYTDSLDDTEVEAMGVLEAPVDRRGSAATTETSDDGGFVNAAPVFPDQDFLTPGDQSDRTSREVAENTKRAQPIGAPVYAEDEDDRLLTYTLGGPDARSFDILKNTGQLRTWLPLNYEARNTYTVVVTAKDSFGATDSIVVTINVTDEDDPAEITVNTSETGGWDPESVGENKR